MSDLPSSSSPEPLDGWKAIAEYLGKSVRTAQRWRHEFGLPVHRVGGREGEHVFAYREELDAWRRRASRSIAADQTAADSAEPAGEPPAASRVPRRIAVFVAAAAAVGLTAWWAFGSAFLTGANRGESLDRRLDGEPSRYAVVGHRFQAYDDGGRLLWSHAFDRDLNPGSYPGHTDPARPPATDGASERSVSKLMAPVHMADIDGDGHKEVLVIAFFNEGLLRCRLHCFDSRGRERWTFDPPDALTFGAQTYGKLNYMPWVTSEREIDGSTSVWVTAQDDVHFPSMVYRLSESGRVTGRYASNGRVRKLRFAHLGGRHLALLAGVNNERKTAALAVLELSQFGGAAPAETAAYRCSGCAPEVPKHYLVFPATAVAATRGGMPFVGEVVVTSSEDVVVSIVQQRIELPGDADGGVAVTGYRLDDRFRVKLAEFAGDYAPIHDYFFSLGRLARPFDPASDARELWPVLRWKDSGFARIDGPER